MDTSPCWQVTLIVNCHLEVTFMSTVWKGSLSFSSHGPVGGGPRLAAFSAVAQVRLMATRAWATQRARTHCRDSNASGGVTYHQWVRGPKDGVVDGCVHR